MPEGHHAQAAQASMRPAATASLPAAPRPAMALGALDEHGFRAATRGERRLEDHPALALAVALCRSKPCASGPTAGAIRGSSNGGRVLAKWIELLEHRNGDAGYHSVRQPG
jgi:hypothetical protein